MDHTIGLQHKEVKRKLKKKENLKQKDKFKCWVNRAIYIVGFVTIIMSIPQITTIWIGKSSAGISIISWIFYCISAIFWVVYGVVNKVKVITISYILWALIDFMVVLGAFIYR